MILFALTLALCVIYEVFFHFNNYKASFWAILNDVKTRKCILPAASLGLDIAREQRIYYKRLKNMARRLERRKWAISLLRFNISPLCVVRHSLRKIPYKRVCLYYWLFLSRFSCHHLKPAIIHIAIPLWNGAKWLNSRDLLLVFFFNPAFCSWRFIILVPLAACALTQRGLSTRITSCSGSAGWEGKRLWKVGQGMNSRSW